MFFLKRSKLLILSVCTLIAALFLSGEFTAHAKTAPFILLNCYSKQVNIGDSFYLIAASTTGKRPAWSSSNSSIASVSSSGKVTAKKAGSVTIRAKSKGAEASCTVKVNKTKITLNQTHVSLENGTTATLTATTSNGSPVKWKSQKKSIAAVSDTGLVTAKKPGETTITASADGSSITCTITVRKPKLTLTPTRITLYRKGSKRLSLQSSSQIPPTWKSNRRSVATVDDKGVVTAIKHGTALITATIDGVSKTCEVVVEQPSVTLSQTEASLKKGETLTLTAKVSSGNAPVWSSSNTAVATVSSKGVITAHQPGKAYIYAAEDGVKSRCTIKVSE